MMPDWDRLQRFIEYEYARGKILPTFDVDEWPPERILHEIQLRTDIGYEVLGIYNKYIEEAQKRGITVEGY
jgi:hypothetical protein